MKKQLKRTVSVLLTIIMVLSMVAVMPMTAEAAGNSFSGATNYSLGSTVSGNISQTNSEDYYTFTLSTSGRINLIATSYMSWIYYYIYDSNYNRVYYWNRSWDGTTNVCSTNETIDLTSGKYYFVVARDGSYTGNYNFRLNFTSSNETFKEVQNGNNNTYLSANSISFNQQYFGQIAENDEVDYYKFNLSSGKITLSANAYMTWIYYYIYDSNFYRVQYWNPLWNSTSGVSNLYTELDLSPGTYYFVVAGGGLNTGNYNFTFSKSLPAPTSVKLNKSSITLNVGASYGLVKTISPSGANPSVTWTSSDSSVATVDSNGKVVGKKAGVATITIKTSNGKTATCKVVVQGSAPKLTSVNANNSGVGISWNKISGVPKYRVYKKVNSSWQKIGDTTGASYTDKSVKGNNTYTYTVRGITANGSNFVTGYDAKGLSIKYTATPSITKREVTSEGIKLTWNKPAGTQKVRLYIKKNGSWSKIGDTVNTSYTYKNVKSGTSYAFTVRTVTTDGKQFTSGYSANGWSQKYVATPQISSLTNTKNGVQIKYNKPAGADKFRIYRKTGSGSWTKLGDTTATTYTDKTAKSGTTYSYTVRCISSDAKSFTSYYNTSGKSIKCKK